MTTIDERVVSLKFDNSRFKSAISSTLASLSQLKSKLNLSKNVSGLDALSNKVKGIGLGKLVRETDGFLVKLSSAGIAASTVITNVTNKLVNGVLKAVKSFTIDPITQGFGEYELEMKSIQTILANTQKYGTKLPEVQKNLDILNTYADKTIYSFSDMTQNIGLFTNAGLRVGEATSMIKGFSNVAAASGTGSTQAANAAYQLSQALMAGKIQLMDWRSLTNANMGNKNMQESLIEIALKMGTLKKGTETATLAQKDFNGSLSKGWLSADVMSEYLKIMTNDYSVAEIQAMGYSRAQAQAFKDQAKTAFEAATKVRTLTQLVEQTRESIGSIFSQAFKYIVGDFNQATEFYGMIGSQIGKVTDAISKNLIDGLLKPWNQLGGRAQVIQGIVNIFKALGSVLKPIGQAFAQVFGGFAGDGLKNLMAFSKAFEGFTRRLILSKEASDGIRLAIIPLAAAIKAAFKVIGVIIKAAGGVIAVALLAIRYGLEALFASIHYIATFIKWLSKLVVQSSLVKAAGSAIHKAVKSIGDAFALVGDKVGGFFKSLGKEMKAVSSPITKVQASMAGLSKAASAVRFPSKIADGFSDSLEKVQAKLPSIEQGFVNFGRGVQSAFKSASSWIKWFAASVRSIGFKDTVIQVYDSASRKLTSTFEVLRGKTSNLGREVQDLSRNGFEKAGEAAQNLSRSVGSFAKNGFEAAGRAIQNLSREISELVQNGLKVLDGWSPRLDFSGITVGIGGVGAAFKNSLEFDSGRAKESISEIGDSIQDLGKKVPTATASMSANFSGLEKFAKWIGQAFGVIGRWAKDVWNKTERIRSSIGELFGQVLQGLGNLFKGYSAGDLASVFNIAAFALIFREVQKFTKSIRSVTDGAAGVLESFSGSLTNLGKSFKSFGRDANASAMLKIAGAIAILSLALIALTLVEPSKLTAAGVAMAGLGVELGVLAKALDAVSSGGFTDSAKMAITAFALVGLATALGIAGLAVAKLGKLDTGALIKGTAAIALIFTGFAGVLKVSKGVSNGAIVQTTPKLAGILAVSIAAYISAKAIEKLGSLDFGVMIKGLAGFSAIMVNFNLLTSTMNKSNPGTSIGIALAYVALAFAMNKIAKNIAFLGSLSWGTIIKGVAGLSASLAALSLATKNIDAKSAGVSLGFSVAVVAMAKAVQMIGTMDFASILKGVGAISALMIAMSLASKLASTGAAGAAGIALMAAAISLLAPALLLLSTMSLGGIGKALLVVGGVVLIFTAALAALSTLAGPLALLSVAALAFGTAIFLAGSGMAMFGTSLVQLAAVMGVSGAAITGFLTGLISLLPLAGTMFGGFITNLLASLVANAPAIMNSISMLVTSIVNTLIGLIPVVIPLIRALLDALIALLVEYTPKLAIGLMQIITSLLNILIQYAPQFVAQVVTLLTEILNTLATHAPELAEAATNLIVNMINAMSNTVGRVVTAITEFVVNILNTLSNSVSKIATAATNLLIAAITAMGKNASRVVTVITDMIILMIKSLGDNTIRIVNAAAETILKVINGMRDAVHKYMPEILSAITGLAGDILSELTKGLNPIDAGSRLISAGKNMIQGFINGIVKMGSEVVETGKRIVGKAVDGIKKFLHIKSPSRLMMGIGEYFGEGLAIGIGNSASGVSRNAVAMAKQGVDAVRLTLGESSDYISNIDDPVIKPVIDLSNVRDGVKTISSMMSKRSVNSIRVGIDDRSNNEAKVNEGLNGTINFVQNNYSPKALSRYDIYRQTNNQLNQIKGVLNRQ